MACCYCSDKVLYSGSLDATQTVGVGLPIQLTKNVALNCSTTDTSVTLSRAGVYQVTATASAATTVSAATNITMELESNGSQLADVESTVTSTSSTDVQTMSLTALVRVNQTVCPLNDNSVTLTLVNTAGEATYSAVTMTVVRL